MRVGSRLRRLVGSASCPWRAALEFHRMTGGKIGNLASACIHTLSSDQMEKLVVGGQY